MQRPVTHNSLNRAGLNFWMPLVSFCILTRPTKCFHSSLPGRINTRLAPEVDQVSHRPEGTSQPLKTPRTHLIIIGSAAIQCTQLNMLCCCFLQPTFLLPRMPVVACVSYRQQEGKGWWTHGAFTCLPPPTSKPITDIKAALIPFVSVWTGGRLFCGLV